VCSNPQAAHLYHLESQQLFEKDCKGLLHKVPISSHRNVLLLLTLFLVLEATLCMVFWAVLLKRDGEFYTFGIRQLCPWDVKGLLYTGLCGHSPLVETLRADFSLSPEDLDALNESRKAQKRAVFNSSRARKRVRDKKNGSNFCDICKKHSSNAENHKRHLKTIGHIQKAAGTVLKSAIKRAGTASRNLAAKKYTCAVCDKSYGSQTVLNRHYDSKIHLDKMALSSSGSSS
jgi:hypothetical protein